MAKEKVQGCMGFVEDIDFKVMEIIKKIAEVKEILAKRAN